MSDCMPCDLENAADERVVYRDDTWACEVPEGYEVPGWFVLRLRRHAEGWHEPTAEELAGFGPVAKRIVAALQQATGAVGTYFMSFGENYKHFHFLLTARPANLAPEHRGGAIVGTRAENLDVDAALAVAAEARRLLAA